MRIFISSLAMLLSQIPFFSNAQDFWQPTNGPYGGIVYDIEVSPDGYIFAATDSGVFVTTDLGENWLDTNEPYLYPRTLASCSNNYVFVGTGGGAIVRTTDNGVSWEIKFGITGTNITALNASPEDHIYVGAFGHLGTHAYRSTDYGYDWEWIATALGNCTPKTFAFEDPGYIFTGTEACGIFRSLDPLSNWTQVNNGLTNLYVNSMTLNSSNIIFAGTEGGVFRSANDGDSWIAINNGLTNLSILSLAINSQDRLFAGTPGGVFSSTDNGTSWVNINAGLADTVIHSLAIDSSSFVYAGSSTGLVYRSIQPITSIKPVKNGPYSSFLLEQNYPNPFNPATVITYRVSRSSHVELIIYDLVGNAVKTLVNAKRNTGVYHVEWDGKNDQERPVSSGVYIYRLKTDSNIQSKKMILLR